MKLYLATNNTHKAEEFARLLSASRAGWAVAPASEAGGMPEVEETGDTFEDNALLKAEALWRQLDGMGWVVADDSGLEVDALDGRPGVFSARYAGDNATDEANRRKLLEEMSGLAAAERTARFVCVLALLTKENEPLFFRGTCEGRISDEEEGSGGFGYDPVFKPRGYDATFGTLPSTVKNETSHRAHAVAELAAWLKRHSATS